MLGIVIYTPLSFDTYAHQILVIDFMMEKISQKKINLTRNFLFTRETHSILKPKIPSSELALLYFMNIKTIIKKYYLLPMDKESYI